MHKLNTKILSEALRELRDGPDRQITLSEMQATAQVNNLSRIADGRGCTVDTWKKLHDTYPSLIPPPVYTSGEQVNFNNTGKIKTAVQAARTANIGTINSYAQSPSLPPVLKNYVDTIILIEDTGKRDRLVTKHLKEAMLAFIDQG